ncbi:MAG TPA: SDR family oxidoreductase [Acidimicrobiia bacterium]|nr:SDR family oxidoreductase [Acidimicrobiia bacterium]
MTKLANAHVVITGGSSGIGLETARLAVARGARVSLIARDAGRLAAAAADVGAAVAAPADVTDAGALATAFTAVTEANGPCDVLVTSAGSSHPGYFARLDDAVFRQQMDVDYFGTLHAVRAVVPSMIDRGRGHLVTISSTAGLIGVFGYSAYGPAKYAVRGLAETLRPELAPHGIVVACAYPPDTRTPGFDAESALKPAETARISAAIKPREAEHVARAIVTGIEKERLVITADVQTAALARAAGLLGPYVRRTMDRQIRKARRA